MNHPAPLVGIPIKPFGVAKQRLHPRLSAVTRSQLGRQIAARTARIATEAGCEVVVVTGDAGVHQWAHDLGYHTVDETTQTLTGLNGAAAALCDYAIGRQRPWLLLHADLPTLTPAEVGAVLDVVATGRAVLAPSHDGGTSAFGGQGHVQFSYGSGSYHRHLRQVPTATIVTRPGLAFDLDTIDDLERVLRHRDSGWIDAIITR